MCVKLLTNNFLSEKAVGKSESKDVHLAVLRVLPEVIRESVDAEQHADYRKGEGGNRGGNGVNPDVTILILYGAVTIDGKTYRVKETVKRDTRNEELARGNGAYCFFQVQASRQLRLRGAELRRSTHHLAIAQISFSQKRIGRPRSWSLDTISASESRLFSPRLSRTRVVRSTLLHWYFFEALRRS